MRPVKIDHTLRDWRCVVHLVSRTQIMNIITGMLGMMVPFASVGLWSLMSYYILVFVIS